MMKSKNGLLIPSVAEIAQEIGKARQSSILYPEMVLAYDCEYGSFCFFPSVVEYWRGSFGKPIFSIPYEKIMDAREIARKFRKDLIARYY